MRRNTAPTRFTLPDARYQSQTVTKLINGIMRGGKKATAEGLVYGAFERIEEMSGRRGVDVFEIAVRNVTPMVEVKPRRVGGATYQVPIDIRAERRETLALRWIRDAARNRNGRSYTEKLAAELMEAAADQPTGAAIRKKDETHRMAEANRALSLVEIYR
ncbi:MAG TPA: 30S ribosomal protein S7 [Dehalococcoidia bacterium]|nr:30S ribosomal protein S7 [Dehalococcoidia bacterium]